MKVFISIFGNLCWVLSIFWAYQKIIYQKVSIKKMCYVAIFYFGIGLVEEVLHTGEIPYYLSDLTGIDIFFFLELEIFVWCWIIAYTLFDRNLKRSIFLIACICSVCQQTFFILNEMLWFLSNGNVQIYYLLNLPMIALLFFTIYLIVEKLNIARIYREFEYKNFSFIQILGMTIIVLFIYDLLSYCLQTIPVKSKEQFLIPLFLMFIMILTMIYYIQMVSLKDKKKYSDMLVKQQNLYIQDLEKIQQNMRTFKHDYKNMMSSIYLQSKEGNMQEIESTISKLMDEFDEDIDKKMNLTNQLANIQINEIKSLLYSKITEINRQHISLHMEVLYPVQTIKMNIMDACRVLGILLDNAIDEVKDHEGDMNLVLSNQEDAFRMIVENSLFHDVDIEKIYQEGYSTKGTQRGMGLISLQKIIDKYSNVTIATQTVDNRFIQEITIV